MKEDDKDIKEVVGWKIGGEVKGSVLLYDL